MSDAIDEKVIRESPADRLPLRPPGRPKGLPNIATREMKQFIAEFVKSEAYRQNLKARIFMGEANHIELLMWHYLYGKPRETIRLETDRPPFQVIILDQHVDPMADEAPPTVADTKPEPPALPEVSFDG